MGIFDQLMMQMVQNGGMPDPNDPSNMAGMGGMAGPSMPDLSGGQSAPPQFIQNILAGIGGQSPQSPGMPAGLSAFNPTQAPFVDTSLNQLNVPTVAQGDQAGQHSIDTFNQLMDNLQQKQNAQPSYIDKVIADLQAKRSAIPTKVGTGEKIASAIAAGLMGVGGNGAGAVNILNSLKSKQANWDNQRSQVDDSILKFQGMKGADELQQRQARNQEVINLYQTNQEMAGKERLTAITTNDNIALANINRVYDLEKQSNNVQAQTVLQQIGSQNELTAARIKGTFALLESGVDPTMAAVVAKKYTMDEPLTPEESASVKSANERTQALKEAAVFGKMPVKNINPDVIKQQGQFVQNYGVDTGTLQKAMSGGKLDFGQPAIEQLIDDKAKQIGVDPALVKLVVSQESSFRQFGPDGKALTSPAGALGLMQLMPATAKRLGVDPQNLEQNLDGGIRELKRLQDMFPGRPDLALAGYNGNADLIKKYPDDPSKWMPETQNYVKSIMSKYNAINGVGLLAPDNKDASKAMEERVKSTQAFMEQYKQRPAKYMQLDANGLPIPGSGDVPPRNAKEAGQPVIDITSNKIQMIDTTPQERIDAGRQYGAVFDATRGFDPTLTGPMVEKTINDAKPLDQVMFNRVSTAIDAFVAQGVPRDTIAAQIDNAPIGKATKDQLAQYLEKAISRPKPPVDNRPKDPGFSLQRVAKALQAPGPVGRFVNKQTNNLSDWIDNLLTPDSQGQKIDFNPGQKF